MPDDLTEIAGNIIIQDGKILLLHRKDETHWEVPGGKVKPGESPTEAAVREAKEEIGVEIKLEKPFYSGEFQKDNEIFLWHGYLAKITSGEPEIEEEMFSKLEWLDSSDLEDKKLAPNLKMIAPSLRKVLN